MSCPPDDVVPEASDDLVSEGDNETNSKESVHAQS